MPEHADSTLKIVFASEAWTTLGRISSEDFQNLRQALTLEAVAASQLGPLSGHRQGVVRSGTLTGSYDLDVEAGTLTVLSVTLGTEEGRTLTAETAALQGAADPPSRPNPE